ncbi:hypothetical protein LCGC14_0393100 [marine sediment metagenome]|uniref:Uncharacterized protein n=1 Tax=marine sediment metagenome TaxID=412755 RepID=A0A0F9T4W9_9ZZZZ
MVERIEANSSWQLPPTPKQVRAITRLAVQLGYHEPVENKPRTRKEARDMIAGFREERKRRQ